MLFPALSAPAKFTRITLTSFPAHFHLMSSAFSGRKCALSIPNSVRGQILFLLGGNRPEWSLLRNNPLVGPFSIHSYRDLLSFLAWPLVNSLWDASFPSLLPRPGALLPMSDLDRGDCTTLASVSFTPKELVLIKQGHPEKVPEGKGEKVPVSSL